MQTPEELKNALVQAADGHLPWVKELISQGADVNGMPLIMAIQCGEFEIVKTLVEAGSDVEINFADTTPLIRAAGSGKPGKGYPEIVEYLLQVGVDVNKKAKDGRSALSTAVSRENEKIVEMLIHAGAIE